MAETAPQIQYRQEFIAGFEQRQSLLRSFTTTEAVIKGNTATFLVADSGSATAVTRGVNGLVPARADNLTQPTATLVEWHDLVRKTGFNVFQSQGDQRAVMQQTSMGVINRKIDGDILTMLETGTITWGSAAAATIPLVITAKTKLGEAGVPFDNNICAVISPSFEGKLMQLDNFNNADYVDRKPLSGADLAWDDSQKAFRWLGVNWIVHPNVNGVGTSDAKCFMFHKSAIGHAYNSSDLQALAGYDQEQDYSWARTSIFMGSSLLQDAGIVEMGHID